ncbi:MAG: N,N-dimethylformamidase beta subunit family domain-containing protein [Nocardioidaceae bacterium]
MVSTSAASFRVQAYRIGGYRDGAGRLIWTSPQVKGIRQHAAKLVAATRTVVAGWIPSLTVSTAHWPAGFYLFKLVASSGYQAFVPFTVRSPSTQARVVLVSPVIDWQAYNTWGGYDLYQAPAGKSRSWAVSFDRPNPPPGANQFLYNVLPTVVLAERIGLPLGYQTSVDVAVHPDLLRGAAGYVSMGHDEYWTVPERRYVTAARDAGTNLAFLSSNTMYWRVRLQVASSGPDRIVVGYKSDASVADPLRYVDPAQTTARWRDPPHPDPENSLTGTLYECYPVDAPYRVVSPSWWGFRGTGARLGSEFPHLVAQEADRVYPVPSTPRPLQILSYADYSCGGSPTSAESTYYTTPSGAGVIDFGTQRWTCALGLRCATLPAKDNMFAREVTTNVLRAFATGPVGRRYRAQDNVGHFPLPVRNQVPAS